MSLPNGHELEGVAVKSQDHYDLTKTTSMFRFCSRGHAMHAVIQGIYQDWGVLYHCEATGCDERWVVCCKCYTNNRSRLYTRRSLTQHKSKKHGRNVVEVLDNGNRYNEVTADPHHAKRSSEQYHHPESHPSAKRTCTQLVAVNNDDDTLEWTMDDDLVEPQETENQSAVFFSTHSIPFLAATENSSLGFTSEKNQRFYQYCATRQSARLEDAGIEFLVKTCLIDEQLHAVDLRNMPVIPMDFQRMIMQYARLCFNMGKKGRNLLCEILQKLHTSGVEDGWRSCLDAMSAKLNHLFFPSNGAKHDIQTALVEPFCRSKINQGAHHFSLSFPTNEQAIRARFVENKNSIIKNLPFPVINDDIPDHAYVSLEDCIRHAMGMAACRMQVIDPFPDDYEDKMQGIFAATHIGNDCQIDDEARINHPSRSRCAYDIYASSKHPSDVLLGYLIFWHDDADTNSSSMQGRAQVWVKSMTIGSPAQHGNLVVNTYPVAIGLKGKSHDAVEERHIRDLQRLQSSNLEPFFVGDVNQSVKCNFYGMADIADQPEKRGSNGLLLGTSNWAARSFVSAEHSKLYPKLKACNKCLLEMRSRFTEGTTSEPLPVCTKCLNWDVLKAETELSHVDMPPDYPYAGATRPNKPPLRVPGFVNRVIVKTDQTTKYIKPFRITYGGLALAIKEAHLGYCDCDWSDKMCTTFLKVECFNKKTIREIMEHAERSKAYKMVVADSDNGDNSIDESYKSMLEKEYEISPEKFGPMPTPANHRRPSMETYMLLEGLLHIGAVGCSKKTLLTVQGALELKKSNNMFIKYNAKTLEPLQKLNLEWMKLLTYSGAKFHGWNGENYLAFSRVMPWFYQNIQEAKKDSTSSIELPPERSQKYWLVKHNRHWLKLRGLTTTGNAKELKDRVAQSLSNPPPILPAVSVDDHQIQYMVNSLYDMWGCLLSEEVSKATILKTEYAIRIFLSSFDDLDVAMREASRSEKKTAGVVSTYNFCCLLNLPDIMRRHGPLHHFWEGGKRGEGILPDIKEQHSQGIRKNWAKNLLKNVYVDRTFDILLGGPIGSPDSSTESVGLPVNKGLFKRYSAICEVESILMEDNRDRKQPLSVVLVGDGDCNVDAKMFAIVKNSDEVVEIRKVGGMSGHGTREKFGWFYYHFILVPTETTTDWADAISCLGSPRLQYALLLPLLDEDPISGMFAVISRNWMRLAGKNKLETLV